MKYLQWIRWGSISSLSLGLILNGALVEAQPQETGERTSLGTSESTQEKIGQLPVEMNKQPKSLPAKDLKPLNPDPNVLDVPTTPEDVTVDSSLNQAITLQQALKLAKRNNRNLQLAELQLRQSQAALAEAEVTKLPTASAQSRFDLTGSIFNQQISDLEDQLQEQLATPQEQSSTRTVFNSSVQLDYDIFTSGQRPASIRAAQSSVNASEKSVETQLQQVRQDVTEDYYDLQQADGAVDIALSAIKNAEETLDNARILEQAGIGTHFDILQSEVQLANQKQQLFQAQSQQETSRRQLAQTLSLNSKATLTAADPVEIAGEWPMSLEDTIAKAQKNRSELGELLDQRKIAKQNERLVKGSFGPQVSATASGNFVLDVGDNDEDFGYSLGIQASKMLFDGGRTKALAKQQELGAKIAENQLANFKNLVRFQVEQNHYTLKSSMKNIGVSECAVTQAEQSLELARLRSKAGIGTRLEISNAETELTQVRSNRLQAITDYNRALVALERFVGHRQQQTKTDEVPIPSCKMT